MDADAILKESQELAVTLRARLNELELLQTQLDSQINITRKTLEAIPIPRIIQMELELLNMINSAVRDSLGIAGTQPAREGPEPPDTKIYLNRGKFSLRIVNSLKNNGLLRTDQVVQMDARDLLEIRNFGRKGLQELAAVLNDMGLLQGTPLFESLRTLKSKDFTSRKEFEELVFFLEGAGIISKE